MLKLDILLYGLATCITRYHDRQDKIEIKLVPGGGPEEIRAYTVALIDDNPLDYQQRINKIIDTIVAAYPARKDYLHYLLDLIAYIDRLRMPHEKGLGVNQDNLIPIFLGFKELFITKKNAECTVHNGSKETTLSSGLINTAWVGGFYCLSGELLEEEVLSPLGLTPKDSRRHEFELKGIQLCNEYQIEQLRKELASEKHKMKTPQIHYGALFAITNHMHNKAALSVHEEMTRQLSDKAEGSRHGQQQEDTELKTRELQCS